MKLDALLKEIEQSLAQNDPSPNEYIGLAQKISDLADMVGWAGGQIDPKGQIASRLEAVMESLRSRHEQTGEDSIAALHDCVAGLSETINQHDQDLVTTRTSDDYEEL